MKTVWLPKHGREVKLVHRDAMKTRGVYKAFSHSVLIIPPTKLPVDGTGNAAASCPMDGNDALGDCGEAMAAHVDNILTFRQGQGTESVFALAALESQYLKVSGGDNGLDEDMVVNQIWKVGIAGNAAAVIVDALDIDPNKVPLMQFAIDNFYAVELAWSVPDAFLNGFAQGTIWDAPGIPNPANGHYVPLADVDAQGRYRLWTWGSWCWVSPAFVASVQPQVFVAFSPRQFDPKTGLDSKGRHITTQAAVWQQCGGNPIPQAVIAAFPPISGPAPVPSPTPSPVPTPTPAPVPAAGPTLAQVQAVLSSGFAQLEKQFARIRGADAALIQELAILNADLSRLWMGRRVKWPTINWQQLETWAETMLKLFGPLAAPIIEKEVAGMNLPPAVQAALDALIEQYVGGKAA